MNLKSKFSWTGVFAYPESSLTSRRRGDEKLLDAVTPAQAGGKFYFAIIKKKYSRLRKFFKHDMFSFNQLF